MKVTSNVPTMSFIIYCLSLQGFGQRRVFKRTSGYRNFSSRCPQSYFFIAVVCMQTDDGVKTQ